MPADVQLNEMNNADSGTEIQVNPGFSGNGYNTRTPAERPGIERHRFGTNFDTLS
jgi:hypothetical protein